MSFARSGLHAESLGSGQSFIKNTHALHRVQPWPATGCLIVAEVVGTGVLALGGAFAKLGMTTGIVILVIGFFVNVFTSLLLGSVARALPDVVTFGDAAQQLLGRRWALFSYFVLYAYLFVTLANYIIVLSDSVRSMLYMVKLCAPVSTLIAAALLIPGNQLRTLADLTILSIVSALTIVATLIICLSSLLSSLDNAGCIPVDPSEQPGFLDYNAAMCTFIFAYTGQTIMLEMQAEMKTPKDFPKAVNLSFVALFVVYLLVSVISYQKCGIGTPSELLQVLPDGPLRAASGCLMVIHLIVTYTILQQVLTRAVCLTIAPEAVLPGFRARTKWFCVSTGIMALAYVVANSIPLFSDIVSLTGGLLSTQCAFTLPAVLFLALHRQGLTEGTPALNRVICVLCYATLVLSAYSTVAGGASSILVMISDAKKGGDFGPFGCKLDV